MKPLSFRGVEKKRIFLENRFVFMLFSFHCVMTSNLFTGWFGELPFG